MPGIHLYTGNRLELLADRFVELLQSEPLPPLQKEIVLVQSRGMARWLALKTATRSKIWANIDCPFPNTFTRSIFMQLLPDIPDTMLYEKKFITWHLMEILPRLAAEPHFYKVRSYLAAGDDQKLYQLAYELADLFDQYTLYRPEMILAWENGKIRTPEGQEWQATLWCNLIEHLRSNDYFSGAHRARLLGILEEKLLSSPIAPGILPSRISVFGVSSLPPYHLSILSALALHTEIIFFVMNPCREYWFDIIADRDIVKIRRKESVSEDSLHLAPGNSLLASMGHLGRDFMALLLELDDSEEIELFSEPGTSTLLESIQQDILHLQEIRIKAMQPALARKTICPDDRSITFLSCHSQMREIEILHDHLLHLFNGAPGADSYEPRDILVMAPDINAYAPYIRAVFRAGNTGVRIPYAISDQSIGSTCQFIETFFKLVALPESRFSSVDVMSLLDSETIRKRFSFAAQDISILQQWVEDTRICWGIDAEHKKTLNLPDYGENTWRAGLDRLLLGYAMPGHNRTLFENILPYDAVEGSNAELLGRFLDFCESLFNLVASLQHAHSLAEWSTILLQAKTDFLHVEDRTEIEDTILQQALSELRDLQEMTAFVTPVSLGVVRSFLHASLEERFASTAGSGGFLTGNTTFCSMLPMRAIPFKVIYLLGMNDGAYPRPGRRRSFDIMALESRRGDRSKRYDDRYLFLETLLSTRQRLVISYVGQSIQDGSKRPPSVLVSELMDYIEQNYMLETSENSPPAAMIDHLTTFHRLQPFHPDYFSMTPKHGHDNLYSYSQENNAAAVILAGQKHESGSLFSAPLLPPPDEYRQVTIEELVSFYFHPVRYLMRKRIGMASLVESEERITSEPFEIKGLNRYLIEHEILTHIDSGGDIESLYQVKRAAGELPHGRMGKVYFFRIFSEVQNFQEKIADLISGQKLEKLEIALNVAGFKISGTMDNVGTAGMVLYRYAALKPKDMIRSWICHLILNRQQTENLPDAIRQTILAGKDRTILFHPVEANSSLLEQLLSIYWQGLTEPLDFFPRASFIFAQAVHNGKSEQEAWQRAAREWEGNRHTGPGEKYDPYNTLCCKSNQLSEKNFANLAKKIFLPLLAHQAPYQQ